MWPPPYRSLAARATIAATVLLVTACEPATPSAGQTAASASASPPASTAELAAVLGPGSSASAPSVRPGVADGDFPAAPASGILGAGVADKVVAAGRAPTVRLVEPGAEPRAPLAYALAKGARVPLGMSLDMTMGVKNADRAVQPTAIPRLALTLDMTTGDVDAKGDAHVDAKLTRVAVEPSGAAQAAMADALRPAMDGLKGFALSYRVSASGRVHDLVAKAPADAPRASAQILGGVSQSFEAMVAPLPSEPVGVGARWRVVSRVSAAGPDLLQLATYTLTAREGGKAVLDVTLTQVAASERVQTPGLPDGVTARVRRFRSSGRGVTRLDLASVAPESGTMTVESAMDVEVAQGSAPGQSTTAESTLRVEFSRPAK